MGHEAAADGPLSETEWEQLRQLLRRFLSHELDQWENWKADTPDGMAYVLLTRALPPGVLPEHFRPI
ncbi:hypothetical protein ACIGXM_03485 [Kitasatospora sp. NPDC052896]|uniref:hypothetical protein n=1 Tax=Kitasatospora sp. NPDC052896 TaxID=3364061 RepID=UPI0037C68FF1